jgi:hypothetical protein
MPNFGSEINQRKYRDPWTPMLVLSPLEKNTLYLGTQYVMKTTNGGLHWQQISPDLTGASPSATAGKPSGAATVQNAKERGFGVVFSIAPSPLKADEIWAGSDTGLLYLTRDGGKSWQQDVTPKGLSDWSKIAMIEASRFDEAVAYVAVDRHRLDDETPYIYRTRDFGKTWLPIATGIAANSFVNAVREDTEKKGLLFAGTELGIYVSFDYGDHWQPLQMNLPVTSVRDITIHGDDLVIATHGRSFWILDDITPLRQINVQSKNRNAQLYKPATAVRVDNDVFLGTPLPPEEPTAKNPPDGAIVDYYLPSAVKSVTLEISDSSGKLVRRYSSGQKKEQEHPPLPIAERWLPKPVVLQNAAGAHRFVWDLRWGSSGANPELDEEGFGSPRGPRVTPGNYRLKLTADGTVFTQPLQVQMDPRCKATASELDEQLRLGLEIFGEVRSSRKALAEIAATKKQLADVKVKVLASNPDVLAQITKVGAAIEKIEKGERPLPGTITGLESASTGLAAALRVAESSDRAIPSQAIDLYREADQVAKAELAEWIELKSTQLAKLNEALQKAGVSVIQISEAELEGEDVVSQ